MKSCLQHSTQTLSLSISIDKLNCIVSKDLGLIKSLPLLLLSDFTGEQVCLWCNDTATIQCSDNVPPSDTNYSELHQSDPNCHCGKSSTNFLSPCSLLAIKINKIHSTGFDTVSTINLLQDFKILSPHEIPRN